MSATTNLSFRKSTDPATAWPYRFSLTVASPLTYENTAPPTIRVIATVSRTPITSDSPALLLRYFRLLKKTTTVERVGGKRRHDVSLRPLAQLYWLGINDS